GGAARSPRGRLPAPQLVPNRLCPAVLVHLGADAVVLWLRVARAARRPVASAAHHGATRLRGAAELGGLEAGGMTTLRPWPRKRVPCRKCGKGVLVAAYSGTYPTAIRCAACRVTPQPTVERAPWQERRAA